VTAAATPPAIDKRARLKQWLESGEISLHPLTFPQRELWEASPVPPEDPANHICCLITVRGPVAPEDCRAAIQLVVDRQDVLRQSFLPGKAKPLQMIRRSGEANFAYRELPTGAAGPEAVEARALEVFREPFNMMQGPLYRVEMLRCGPDHHVLVFAIHHSIADGWTLGVFVQDLCAAYIQIARGIKTPLPPLPQTHAEWGAAERAFWQPGELEKRATFWRQQLAGAKNLWGDVAPMLPPRLQRWVTHLPEALASAARELAKKCGATLFSTLLTAFQITLHGWKGAQDIVVGSPVANRNKQVERETMGYYAGIVPLRGRIQSERSFRDALRVTNETALDCFARAMPFVELMKIVGDAPAPGHHPIFDARFALQNHPVPDVDLQGLSANLRMRSTGTARFHLGCEVTEEAEGMEVAWLYREGVLDQAAVQELDCRYQAVLAAACGAPETRTSQLVAV
jgi:hypothetical protein